MNKFSLKNISDKITKGLLYMFEKANKINWILLVAIICVFNVNIKYKIVALLLTFLITLKQRLPFKEIPFFYYTILFLSILHFVLGCFFNDDNSYFIISAMGVSYWLIALLFSLQIKNISNKIPTETIRSTLAFLFILNFIFCLVNYINISLDAGVLNPYTFKGLSEKYFMSTGDYIYGIFGNTSFVNAAACFLGVIYFFEKKRLISILALISMLLATSNLDNIFLISILALIIIVDKIKINKAFSFCLLAIIFTFYVKVSPDNFSYIKRLGDKEKNEVKANFDVTNKQKIRAELDAYKDSVIKNSLTHQYTIQKNRITKIKQDKLTSDTDEGVMTKNILIQKLSQIKKDLEQTEADSSYFNSLLEKKLKVKSKLDKIKNAEIENENLDKYPGKLTSFIQTGNYVTKDIKNFLIGSGQANYSSKLAFDVCAVGEGGRLTEQFDYESDAFKKDHLKIYTHFFSQSLDKHSVVNSPFSVYNQIIGEYGIFGFLALVIGYFFYFIRRTKNLIYGRYLIMVISMLFLLSYWFESLTIIILFELMLFVEIKKNENEQNKA